MTTPSPTQIAPATDELITSLERALTERGISTAYSDHVLSLIARIKAEREQTICECINAVQDYGLKFIDHPDFCDALEALRRLLSGGKSE